MTLGRIAELLEPFVPASSISPDLLDAIKTYLDLLVRWNSKVNLSAIRDPEEMVTRHFGESLFTARQLFPRRDLKRTAIDIGSGAGFPGLPIKLWARALESTLVESNQRKATFLREAIRTLGLEGVSVVSERAERISMKADLVTLRAVEQFEKILPMAGTLVGANGRLAALIGLTRVSTAQAILPDVNWETAIAIPKSRNRVLLIGMRYAGISPGDVPRGTSSGGAD